MQCGVVMVVVVAVAVSTASACFITNCPPGGKRSGPTASLGRSRTCTSCGPGLLGRCLGPEICCGPRIGCFLGTREARMCRAENLLPVLCSNADLKTCGARQEGHCAAPGLCCTEGKCEIDERCVMDIQGTIDGHKEGRQRLPLITSLSDDNMWDAL